MKTLSEHLSCAVWVNAHFEEAADCLMREFARFGPVRTERMFSWAEAKAYIVPQRSFASRYLVLDQGKWSVVVNDRLGELGLVNGVSISRAVGSSSVAAYFIHDSRQFHVIERGKIIRSVVCYRDGGRWFFHQEGHADPIEESAFYDRRQIRERLSPRLVCEYVERKTGLACPPNWKEISNAVGVQRSVKDVVVEIVDRETVDDV